MKTVTSLTFALLWFASGGRAVTVVCWWGSSYVKLALDIFMQSSRVLMNVSQVAPSKLVASFSFCKLTRKKALPHTGLAGTKHNNV
jgi:hypothetical protein